MTNDAQRIAPGANNMQNYPTRIVYGVPLLLNFPLSRALCLPTASVLYNNEQMPSSTHLFKSAVDSKDYEQAIRILASVKSLQTQANILACCKTAKLAFEVLKFVPASRKEPKVLSLAGTDLRVARLIVDDLPSYVNDALLSIAINREEAWADRYQEKFNFSPAKRKKLLEGSKKTKRSAHRELPLDL